jgi:hypothetical protein
VVAQLKDEIERYDPAFHAHFFIRPIG